MKISPASQAMPACDAVAHDEAWTIRDRVYESPLLFDVGRVEELHLGNSSSGKADSNSQYYW